MGRGRGVGVKGECDIMAQKTSSEAGNLSDNLLLGLDYYVRNEG